jgi:hypothetical protein
MVYQEAATDSDSTKLGGSLLNAAALVGMMVVITFGMFFLYKYRCMKVDGSSSSTWWWGVGGLAEREPERQSLPPVHA